MKIKRKWVGLLFSAILCLSLFPITAFAANQGELWINGENIVQAQDNTVACGDGTAVYTSSSSTLTLTNAVITQANLISRAIDIPKDMELKIVLNGENTIDVATNGFFAGANSNITFSGDGSLTIKSDYAPFVSNSNITIDGATLIVFNENDGAIQVDGTLTIQNGAYVEANGQYYGVLAGSLSITTGSELTAASNAEGGNPIFVIGGDLGISDSTVSGKGYYPIMAVGNITITNSTVVAEASADFGIYSQNDLLIKGNSDVTAKGAAAIGAKNSFKLEPPEGGLIDVFVGASENEAQPIENSPLSQSTDLSNYGTNNVQYFRSAPHEHVYDQKVVSDTYKASDATCTEPAEYYYSCVCGAKGTEIFESGNALGHTWGAWISSGDNTHSRTCSVCMATETEDCSGGGTATCTEKAVCDICGEEYGEPLGHDVVKTDAKAPTCTEAGNMEYWHCEACGKYFRDEAATEEIGLESAVLKATGHSYEDGRCTVCGEIDPDFKPVITAGANGTWKKGTKGDLSFTSNAAFADFLKVQVDGKDLDASNYTVKEGSTIVALKAAYLETLSAGKHTLAVVSKTGSAETEFTIKAAATAGSTQSPQTGDSGSPIVWLAVLLAAGAALTGAALYGRKRKYSR